MRSAARSYLARWDPPEGDPHYCGDCGSEMDESWDWDEYQSYRDSQCSNPWCPHTVCSDCDGPLDDVAFPDGGRIRCGPCWDTLNGDILVATDPEPAEPNMDYVTFDRSLGDHDLVVLASYQRVGSDEVVELVEAIDEWGEDWLDDLQPHEYEDLRLTALSLFHCAPKDR